MSMLEARICMPLTEKVAFTATLQKFNKVQIPKLIRWRFKLESDQALKVGVDFVGAHKGWQFFYTKARVDGRITIPKLVLSFFSDKNEGLTGAVLEVTLEPA